ncbi:MAG: periplasmic mercuric ion binding protein [Anaerophaga sp.]|uniref:heavy-metal-associated domain-containing protein n=1 Tax=Anaerophaga thermohalophila TaxID=177400 RepID=UPI000237CA69|nr:cation transporter [Anaerophaga thermohalophila]MDI3521111.1 periplasmic mercuric ion binding protein [Anaerophaga sp.]MDK2841141.1 periplasmic mercuric ion binding protein [Anaerophaga sp.]MDN5291754.1 periplasmic mercuric ion binding protein [Anaerophaga sp.]
MKRTMLSLLTMLLMGSVAVFAQSKNEKFEVKGNCGMCEKRIEKAAKSVDGVSKADWDQETMMATVVFDESQTSMDDIQKAIAKAGHDTGKHKASDEVYNNLPACCKYDRSEAKDDKDDHQGHQH